MLFNIIIYIIFKMYTKYTTNSSFKTPRHVPFKTIIINHYKKTTKIERNIIYIKSIKVKNIKVRPF